MPLSSYGSLSLGTAGESSKPAYLVKFPEEIWTQLQSTLSSGQGISIAVNDGMELQLPTTSIPLTLQSLGASTELYTLPTSSSTLAPLAISNHRLTLPLTLPSSLLSEKARLPTQTPTNVKTLPLKAAQDTPMIPLKTRVIQLLALGEISPDDIVDRVGMAEEEVMRVVNVVGRQTPSGDYTLQPSKYTQVKIQPWKYTHAEKLQVIRLAHLAFDELDLPPDADERVELDKKESEVVASSRSSTSSEGDKMPYTPVGTGLGLGVGGDTSLKNGKNGKKASPVGRKEASPAGKEASPAVVGKKERGKKPTGLIGKQKAKFVKEKRAGSMGNMHGEIASPRVGASVESKEVPGMDLSGETKQEAPQKTKLELAIEARKLKKALERRESASKAEEAVVESPLSRQKTLAVAGKGKRKSDSDGDTSTKRKSPPDTDPPERGRARDIKPVQPPPKRRLDYSSSSSPSTSPERNLAAKSPVKRKPPPPSLNLVPKSKDREASVDVPPPNLTPKSAFHHIPTAEGTRSGARDVVVQPDPEVMRERYEELFPAYELLTARLRKLHDNARGGNVDVGKEEVAKLVDRWGRWHKELEGIRRWFGED